MKLRFPRDVDELAGWHIAHLDHILPYIKDPMYFLAYYLRALTPEVRSSMALSQTQDGKHLSVLGEALSIIEEANNG
jgi:hypothetical protein